MLTFVLQKKNPSSPFNNLTTELCKKAGQILYEHLLWTFTFENPSPILFKIGNSIWKMRKHFDLIALDQEVFFKFIRLVVLKEKQYPILLDFQKSGIESFEAFLNQNLTIHSWLLAYLVSCDSLKVVK